VFEVLASGTVVAAGVVPFRQAIPLPAAAVQKGLAGSTDPNAALEEAQQFSVTLSQWLPEQRCWARRTSGEGRVQVVFHAVYLSDLVLPPLLDAQHPFQAAIVDGALRLVEAFIALNVQEALSPSEQEACVCLAVKHGHIRMLQLLVTEQRFEVSPAVLDLAARSEDSCLVDVLLRSGATSLLQRPAQRSSAPEIACTAPLARACLTGNVESVRLILKFVEDERIPLDFAGVEMAERGEEPRAAGIGPTDPPVVCCAAATEGRSPSRVRILRMLIASGFDVNARSPADGVSALHLAAERGDLTMLEELVHRGARFIASRQTLFTPLHSACIAKQWHVIPVLLGALKAQKDVGQHHLPHLRGVNALDAYGRTAMDICVADYVSSLQEGHADTAKARMRALHMAMKPQVVQAAPALSAKPRKCGPVIFGAEIANFAEQLAGVGVQPSCSKTMSPDGDADVKGPPGAIQSITLMLAAGGWVKQQEGLFDTSELQLSERSGVGRTRRQSSEGDDVFICV